jgi:radical SAM-linked protein
MEENQASTETPRQRVRVCYAKGETIKFISHHDEFRLWERTLRRADLPLLYKQGFNPQPHIQFAAPLGVGITGVRELVDFTFSPPLALDAIAALLSAKLPPGVELVGLEEVPLKTESLQNLVLGADYTILIYAEPDEIAPSLLQDRIAAFLATPVIWRERERKGERYTYNLRPLVFELRYDGYDTAGETHQIFLRVQQRAGATGRPDEVVDALGFDDFARTLRRDRLYFADAPADVATFAVYPVITQAEIAGAAQSGAALPRRAAPAHGAVERRPAGRSLGERAGDEFD